jgi:hypothetical protein
MIPLKSKMMKLALNAVIRMNNDAGMFYFSANEWWMD